MEERTITYSQLYGQRFAGWGLVSFGEEKGYSLIPDDVFREWRERGFGGSVTVRRTKGKTGWAWWVVGVCQA